MNEMLEGALRPRRCLTAVHTATAAVVLAAAAIATAAWAQDADSNSIQLVEGKPFIHVLADGESVKIQRIQDPSYELTGYYARTGRKCPPFCIHPMHVAPGVETIGEVEMFEFMEGPMRDGDGLLIDARTPQWYEKGTIPGALNVPFTIFPDNPKDGAWNRILADFGAKPRGDVGQVERTLEEWGLVDAGFKTEDWDFSEAKELVLFCNGPACDQSPRAIRALLSIGYPAEKLKYYRGGMQLWELWGLTTYIPKKQ